MKIPRNPDVLFGLGLALLFIPGLCIIGTEGEFPLNDDWAYALSVWSVVEDGRLVIDDWPAMTLVAQVLWGSIFCKVFGLSFEVLRWSTLVNAWVAGMAMYFVAKRLGGPRVAVFAALTLFLNPLIFSLSYTFMTDVHFMAVFLVAILFFLRYLQEEKITDLIWATLFSVVSVLIRQPGLFIPLAFGIVIMLRARHARGAAAALLPFLLTFSALRAYLTWLDSQSDGGETVGGFSDLVDAFFTRTPGHFASHIEATLLYIGLFVLPMLVLLVPGLNWKRINKKALVALSVLVLITYWVGEFNFFPAGNILYNLGLGPKVLKDSFWDFNVRPMVPNFLWESLDLFALAGNLALLAVILASVSGKRLVSLFKNLRESQYFAGKVALFLIFGFYFAFVISITSYFDRYTLPLVVCAALLIITPQARIKKPSAIAVYVLFGLMFLFDLTATHDYLSWNRARHTAYTHLTQDLNIETYSIDGGFELNGWKKAGPLNQAGSDKMSWWFVTYDEYVLSFGDIGGFDKIGAYPFKTLLPPGRDSIFILKKNPVKQTRISDFPIRSDLERLSEDSLHFRSLEGDHLFAYSHLRTDEEAHSGNYSIKLTPADPFGLTIDLPDAQPGEQFLVSIWRKGPGTEAGLVLSSPNPEEYYHFEHTHIIGQEKQGWQHLQLQGTLKDTWSRDTVSIYIWNPGKKVVWFDDIEIQRSGAKAPREEDPGRR